MKTLYMIRHAKSSWKHDVSDRERPLNKRGFKSAEAVSEYLVDKIETPQLLVSSNANRALTTANYFKNSFNIADENFKIDASMYDFSGRDVMRIIKGCDDTIDRLMLFGHNHAFTSIVNMLGNKYIENVPTCGFVMIQFETEHWNDIVNGKTVKTVFPKEILNN